MNDRDADMRSHIVLSMFKVTKLFDSEQFGAKNETNVSQVNLSQIRKHFSALEQAADDWVPVELELVDRMWIPDAEILKLKGFR